MPPTIANHDFYKACRENDLDVALGVIFDQVLLRVPSGYEDARRRTWDQAFPYFNTMITHIEKRLLEDHVQEHFNQAPVGKPRKI